MSTPVPDLKPNATPLPPGSECCGCCEGVEAQTPQQLYNRYGLARIAYRIGDFARFRASLHAALSSSQFAPLAQLRTRDDADFTLGLTDAFACAADVLTFYQERIANESYLRTATERVSLQEMGKLIDYRLRPGLAAETWLAFALETPPVPPPGAALEPGSFVTGIPASLSLPAGLQVQSVPGEGEQPQTFETAETIVARPEWGAIRPWLSEVRRPGRGDVVTYVAGVRSNVNVGDALVFVGDSYLTGANPDAWDVRFVDGVEPQPDANRTLIRWSDPLVAMEPYAGLVDRPEVHVLRQHLGAFGHNAPMWFTLSADFRNNYPGADGNTTDWPDFTLSPAGSTSNGGFVDLESIASDARAGGYAVLTKPDEGPIVVLDPLPATPRVGAAAPARGGFGDAHVLFPELDVDLYRIGAAFEVSRAQFALTGKVTRLRLAGARYDGYANAVRATTVHVASEALTLAPYPVDAPVGGDRIPLDVAAEGLLAGRAVVVRGQRVRDDAPVTVRATLIAVHSVGPARCALEIAPPLAEPLVRDSVVVHANVAPASHGESVSQILGAGQGNVAFQRFELRQLPLTYRASANETGAASELTVRVADVAWTERPTLFGAAPTDHAYTLTRDEQGRAFVAFGDGNRGARLPTGVNNVRASYRKGLGAQGNVAPDKLTQLVTRPLGLKSVANPLAAEGGTDPEPADVARQSMPLATRTLGRVVSLLDYEDFARAFGGVTKARAQVLQLAAGTTIAITIAGADGAVITPASPVWQNLLAALKGSGDPHVAVRLLSHAASTFFVGLRVKCDPAYESARVLAAVERALRDRYAFAQRELGQPVHQSEVVATAQSVVGVVAIDVARLYGGTDPTSQTQPSNQVRLLASRMRVDHGVPLAAEILTLDPAPFDLLEPMP